MQTSRTYAPGERIPIRYMRSEPARAYHSLTGSPWIASIALFGVVVVFGLATVTFGVLYATGVL